MSYFPKRVKKRRASWLHNLDLKLALVGVQRRSMRMWPNMPRPARHAMLHYAWKQEGDKPLWMQVKFTSLSYHHVTVKAARHMEII